MILMRYVVYERPVVCRRLKDLGVFGLLGEFCAPSGSRYIHAWTISVASPLSQARWG